MGYNEEKLEEYIRYREVKDQSENSILTDRTAINQLIKFTNNKRLDKINEKETLEFLGRYESIGTKTQYATRLIGFYKWLYKLDKRERPENLKWFEYPSKEKLIKRKDPEIKNQLITPEEYKKIIQFCGDERQWGALFETMFLSGGRPDEINNMNIKDVIINENNKVEVWLKKSKTIPRKVPLPEIPVMLLRWLSYHPKKEEKEAPLFISYSHRNYLKRMVTVAINRKFDTVKRYTKIKKTLTPHCFRKTRATIMFSSRNPIYDDTEMGQFFGWKMHTVSDRREQYDLRNYEDLKNKIQGYDKVKIETFDTLKQDNKRLKKERDKVKELKNELKELKEENKEIVKDVKDLKLLILKQSHDKDESLNYDEKGKIYVKIGEKYIDVSELKWKKKKLPNDFELVTEK